MSLNLDETKIREFLLLKAVFEDGANRVERISPNLQALETKIINAYMLPGEDIHGHERRFAVAIGVAKEGDALPECYQCLVIKRILFAYYKKYRSLKGKLLQSRTITVEEAMNPIPEEDKNEFHQFCIATSY